MKFTAFLGLAFWTLLLAACGAAPDPQARQDSYLGDASLAEMVNDPQPLQPSLVELDVFSGRENPTWALSEEQSLALGELLAGLEEASQPVTRFDGLGYRGFLVKWIAPESRSEAFISAGYDPIAGISVVQVEAGDEKVTYLDPQRGVEKWLLESGKAFLDAELFDSLSEEIQ